MGFSPRERRQSVITLFPVFKHSDFGKTKAAELASMKVGRSNKTVHEFHCELTQSSTSGHRRSDAY